MIKNERQYRITKAHAERFEKAIAETQTKPDKQLHPKLQKAQLDGMRSQLADLRAELEEYDALRSGRKKTLKLGSLQDLPQALIQARIASGLSQDDLAERLKIKPQQIQRYEATDYMAANLARITEVAQTLGLEIGEDVFLPGAEYSQAHLIKRLSAIGFDRDFVVRRLLPRPSQVEDQPTGVALEGAESIERIYGWSPASLFGTESLDLQNAASASARFKLPARVRERSLGPYVIYAHYLALLVIDATAELQRQTLSSDAKTVRQEIIQAFGSLTFENTLKYVWSKGVAVLPLNDAGTFHGACWRFGGRNVIVLKQRTRSVARWLHDLLHEYYHAAQNSDLEEHPVIEASEMSPERRNSREEQDASAFAGDVMLDGKAEQLAEKCVAEAKGKVEWLKNAVPRVAANASVPVDALANYMAFRLSLQGLNWWGAASNLQEDGSALLCSPREFLLENTRLSVLNPVDRELLLRALEPLVLGFAGKIGSGKSTISKEVANALGWTRASFGDYLRSRAKSSGFEQSREVLQEIGASLIENDPKEFCRAVLAHYKWNAGEPLVIDGIRHEEILEALRSLVAPLEVRLVFLEVPDNQRLARLQKVNETVAENLAEVELHSTEVQVDDRLKELADLKLAGTQPVGELVSKVVGWVHQGDGALKPCLA